MPLKVTTNSVELAFEKVLLAHNIKYTCPDQARHAKPRGQGCLDFHLTEYGVSVEIKSWPSERMYQQLVTSGECDNGVIVIIGLKAVEAFDKMLRRGATCPPNDSI